MEVDYDNIKKLGADIIEDNYVLIENNIIRHNALKVSVNLLSYLMS